MHSPCHAFVMNPHFFSSGNPSRRSFDSSGKERLNGMGLTGLTGSTGADSKRMFHAAPFIGARVERGLPRMKPGGRYRARTCDLLGVNQPL
jgi:hypothetical protein